MTTSPGFDKPLYILAFDDRDLIQSMSESEDMLTPEHVAQIASARAQVVQAKGIVYDGFEAALTSGIPKDKAGLLVDEQFGARILESAAARGYVTACPAEKSRQDEFDFEYGEDFAKHIDTFQPNFCKVLVRYNPQGDQDLNRRQSDRLKRLSEYLHSTSRTRFMLELLVPPTIAQLKQLNGDKQAYNVGIRPGLTVDTIRQLQDAQVEPDVWGIEGLYSREDCEKVVAAARRGGREKVSCIVLGASEDEENVRRGLKIAAAVPGFTGFVVGRTVIAGPLSDWAAGGCTSKSAATAMGRRYSEFVNIFEKS